MVDFPNELEKRRFSLEEVAGQFQLHCFTHHNFLTQSALRAWVLDLAQRRSELSTSKNMRATQFMFLETPQDVLRDY